MLLRLIKPNFYPTIQLILLTTFHKGSYFKLFHPRLKYRFADFIDMRARYVVNRITGSRRE
jgi:hypothetical protein